MLLVVLVIVFYTLFAHADAGYPCVQTGPPDSIRVAILGPNKVTVSWKTYGIADISAFPPVIEDDTPSPQVEYSTSPTLATKVVSTVGTSTTYGNTSERSWFHNCILLVKPSTQYYYRIPATPPCVTTSEIYSFMSPPTFGSTNPITISIVGDLGNDKKMNNNSATKTISALANVSNSTNLFLHVGDISYADSPGIEPFEVYEAAWNTFQKNMQVVTANNIYMTLPGNHEVTCNQLGDNRCVIGRNSHYRNFTAYFNRFHMPGDVSEGFVNLWYSFDYGLAHFVIIDTETDFPDAPSGPNTRLNGGNFATEGTQLGWLEADLKAANLNRHNVPWVIVSGHRPFYGSAPDNTHSQISRNNCDSCRDSFGELLFNNNVDFYFCGHVNWYERLFPVNGKGEAVAQNYINQKGVIHVTTGAGGAAEGADYVNATGVANASARIISGYGYTQLAIKDDSNCQLSFYDSVQGKVTDSVAILRAH